MYHNIILALNHSKAARGVVNITSSLKATILEPKQNTSADLGEEVILLMNKSEVVGLLLRPEII